MHLRRVATRSPLARILPALAFATLTACSGGEKDPPEVVAGPTGLTVTPVASTRLSIAWTDTFSNETGFRVERGDSAAGPFTEVTTTATDVASFTDLGLMAETTYHYRVAAELPAGRTSYSAVVSGTTPVATVGTLSLHEVSYPALAAYGQGLLVEASFTRGNPAPVMEESPGSPLGCKAWELTPAEVLAARVGIAEGTLTIAVGDASPVFPACDFIAGSGYACLGATGTGGTIAAGPMAGTFTLTDLDATFSTAGITARHVSISGAVNPGNNGTFPILALGGANTIVAANAAYVAETMVTGWWIVVAGAGPIPAVADPGFLGDGDTVSFALAAGGGNDVESFTTPDLDVADDFTLDASSTALLSTLNPNGNAFTLSCETGNCGAGTGTLTTVEVRTTDAPVAGLAPYAMPAPTTKAVRIRCSSISATSITVPAAYSAFLVSAGATRIEARFIRSALATPAIGEPVSVSAGHAVIGCWTAP